MLVDDRPTTINPIAPGGRSICACSANPDSGIAIPRLHLTNGLETAPRLTYASRRGLLGGEHYHAATDDERRIEEMAAGGALKTASMDDFDLRMSEGARPLYEAVKTFIHEEVDPITEEFYRLGEGRAERCSWAPGQLELLDSAKKKAREQH